MDNSAFLIDELSFNSATGDGSDWFSSDSFEVTPNKQSFSTTSSVSENKYSHEIDIDKYFGESVIVFSGDAKEDFDSQFEGGKECENRLKLLAQSYSDKITFDLKRDIKARIEILEKTIEGMYPRYDEEDWNLLQQFQESISKLKVSG